jgi:hypothetical protein
MRGWADEMGNESVLAVLCVTAEGDRQVLGGALKVFDSLCPVPATA